MDRKKTVRWEKLLPICLALASGCESRGTSGRPDRALPVPSQRQSALAEPRRLVASVQPTGFRAQQATDSDYLPPPADSGLPATARYASSPVWRGGQSAPQTAMPGEQAMGPDFAAETPGEPISDWALPGANFPPAANVPAVVRPLPSEPMGDDALPVRQPAAGPLPTEPLPTEPLTTEPLPTEPGSSATAPQQRLPWAEARPRSAEMEAVAQSADGLIRQGFRLAERGAVYSARLKFFAALSLVARSLDVEQQTQVYTRSLVAGRGALVEAWDFRASGLPMATDMARIVAAHRTSVLAHDSLDSLSPVSAQQRYFSYAQEQLALAAGREPVGSMALYGLGKTAVAVHDAADAANVTVAGEQMACYQAALMVDNRNFRAAHELGVLLAAHGRLEAARDLFQYSLAISENAATWRNLAVIYGRLGDTQQSAQAGQRADHLMNTRLGAITGANLRWVDPETFAKSPPPNDELLPPSVAPASKNAPAAATAPAKKRVAQWPWKQEARQ